MDEKTDQQTVAQSLRMAGRVPGDDQRLTFLPGAEPRRQYAGADLADEPTVTMIFPHDVKLTVGRWDFTEGEESPYIGRTITFRKGPQEVPVSLKDHFYLKAHGIVPYEAGNKVISARQKAIQAQVEADKAKAESDRLAGEAAAAEIAAKAEHEETRRDERNRLNDLNEDIAVESSRSGKPVEQIKKERAADTRTSEYQPDSGYTARIASSDDDADRRAADIGDKARLDRAAVDQKATDAKAKAERDLAADTAESARGGKPVTQVRSEREAKEANKQQSGIPVTGTVSGTVTGTVSTKKNT
jgi:hypothetical protein